MKKRLLFLFMCILSLCACKTSEDHVDFTSETSNSFQIKPHVPDTEPTIEEKIKNMQNAISTMSYLYNKMESFKKSSSDYTEGINKLTEVENTYAERITEIESLTLSDLSEMELDTLEEDIQSIISSIREVNDLFEFR